MKSILFALFLAVTLTGCNQKHEVSAEDVAVEFFDALYNKKDIKQATKFCTPNFAEKVAQYKTAKNVARRLFNMSFDSTKIDAALSDFKVREEFNSSGTLTILFTGTRQGNTYKELKRIRLVKQADTWLVDKLLKDPM